MLASLPSDEVWAMSMLTVTHELFIGKNCESKPNYRIYMLVESRMHLPQIYKTINQEPTILNY
jgi:hypothetical protein